MIAPLVTWTEKGLYCPEGDFYVDPSRGVENAVITHAHSDHARRGSRRYLCASSSVGLVKERLGEKITVEDIPFGKRFRMGAVTVSLHPAGHILGSAQVRIERKSEVWVVSGDYKREPDPSCEPFEVVPCDTFITEATFGTPRYVWEKSANHGAAIFDWWQENAKHGRNSLLFGYSLGKAQRILAELAPHAKQPVIVHEAIPPFSKWYSENGITLAPTLELESLFSRERVHGELILAPASILKTDWQERLGDFETAFASGWMQRNGGWSRGDYDHSFVMSDHADWEDLNRTIDETGARRVFVLHRNGALIRHLRKRGLDAHPASALASENFRRIAEVNLSLF